MTRLPTNSFTWPWGESEPCPCGRGEIYGRCCKRGSRRLPYIEMPALEPPGATTGYAHRRCFLSSTENCSNQISREHYISRGILQEFPQVKVSGLRWQHPDSILTPGIEAMTAKILCTRHNSALAPLDELALHAFRAFTGAPDYVASQLNPGRAIHYLVSGDALELWMVKLMCGIFFGGIASVDGIAVRDTCGIDRDVLASALTSGRLPTGSGLFVTQGTGEMPKQAVSVAPMTDTSSNRMVGIRVGFGTISFETLIVRPPNTAFRKMVEGHRYKPGVIDFNGVSRDARIVLTWRNQGNSLSRLGLEIAPLNNGGR